MPEKKEFDKLEKETKMAQTTQVPPTVDVKQEVKPVETKKEEPKVEVKKVESPVVKPVETKKEEPKVEVKKEEPTVNTPSQSPQQSPVTKTIPKGGVQMSPFGGFNPQGVQLRKTDSGTVKKEETKLEPKPETKPLESPKPTEEKKMLRPTFGSSSNLRKVAEPKVEEPVKPTSTFGQGLLKKTSNTNLTK